SARAVGEIVSRLRGCPGVVTGRYHGLGKRAGWAQIEVKPFDSAEGVKQLEAEWPEARAEDRARVPGLAKEVGDLPLALSLAAGHLADGRSVDGFLKWLHKKRLDLGAADPAVARKTIAATFALSLEVLRKHLGEEAERLLPGFEALGHAPLAGFGRSLG